MIHKKTLPSKIVFLLQRTRKIVNIVISLKYVLSLKMLYFPTSAQNMGGEDIHSLRKFPSYLISDTYT
jgi:hypothetical protein